MSEAVKSLEELLRKKRAELGSQEKWLSDCERDALKATADIAKIEQEITEFEDAIAKLTEGKPKA